MFDHLYAATKGKPILVRQFIKFCIVGASNTFVDFGIYIFLTRLLAWHYMIAAAMAFLVAVSWSFHFNHRWTFRSRGDNVGLQYIRFIAANCLSLMFNLSLFYIIVDIYGVYDLFAKIGAGSFVALFNFNLNRLWTFSSRKAG